MSKEYEEVKSDLSDGKTSVNEDEVEGYASCKTQKSKCLTDCPIPTPSPMLSELN